MKVVKDGVTVAPGLALGSWLAFKKMGNEAMVMGDLVLTDDEVEPVMLKLQQNGIEQTSIRRALVRSQRESAPGRRSGPGCCDSSRIAIVEMRMLPSIELDLTTRVHLQFQVAAAVDLLHRAQLTIG